MCKTRESRNCSNRSRDTDFLKTSIKLSDRGTEIVFEPGLNQGSSAVYVIRVQWQWAKNIVRDSGHKFLARTGVLRFQEFQDAIGRLSV